MNRIIEILMKRDNLSNDQAIKIFEETKESISLALDSGADYDEIEDIMASELGLEMDYLLDIV